MVLMCYREQHPLWATDPVGLQLTMWLPFRAVALLALSAPTYWGRWNYPSYTKTDVLHFKRTNFAEIGESVISGHCLNPPFWKSSIKLDVRQSNKNKWKKKAILFTKEVSRILKEKKKSAYMRSQKQEVYSSW